MGIDAGTVFDNTERYDVSKEPFHITHLNNAKWVKVTDYEKCRPL
jgi:hypothetical protein